MTADLIAGIEVTDPEGFGAYRTRKVALVEGYDPA